MTNFQVYRKTISFSLLMFVVDLLIIGVIGGCATAGFFIANDATDKALIGLVIGFVIGIILGALISIFVVNRIKAAQIAMMTRGVTEDSLPGRSFKAGFEEVKGRFAKITLFFFITNAIKSVFRQLGRGITNIGTAIGGNVGGSIGSTIDSAIQTLIGYLCDCCLGWILYRKDENSAKAACEGAVIFFKHGKTLIRNVGRIFGMGLLSFVLIGGAFFGISYVISLQFPGAYELLANEIAEAVARGGGEGDLSFLTNPQNLMLFICALGGVITWSIVHSVLIRPFILIGVLRNFMAAGQKEIPTEEDFKMLDSKSPRFAKLHNSI